MFSPALPFEPRFGKELSMSTEPVRVERRCGQRFQLHLPLTLQGDGRMVPGYAQDVSARGLFLFAELPIAVGAVVELTFTMPSEVTLGENMRVRARGRVLRTTSPLTGPAGIAVQLDSYQYLPSLECESAAELARVAAGERAGTRDNAV